MAKIADNRPGDAVRDAQCIQHAVRRREGLDGARLGAMANSRHWRRDGDRQSFANGQLLMHFATITPASDLNRRNIAPTPP